MTDWRDYLVMVVWIVLSVLTITAGFSTGTLRIVLFVAWTAFGTEVVLRVHPLARTRTLHNRWRFWLLPCIAVMLSLTALGDLGLDDQVALIVLPVVWCALLGLTLTAAYHGIARKGQGYRSARIFLSLMTYSAVLTLFLVVYPERARSIFSPILITTISAPLALGLLVPAMDLEGWSLRSIAFSPIIIGVLLGGVSIVLNYRQLPGVTSGLLLLLGFYLAVGMLFQWLTKRLTVRVLLEFGFITLVSLLLIHFFAP